MKKKFLHDFESYRDTNKKTQDSVKEGISIYELEDDAAPVENTEETDLDAQTPEAPATEEAPVEDVPAIEPEVESTPAPVEEPAAPSQDSLDFGDGSSISQDTAIGELEFVVGAISNYQKLAKREINFDDKTKEKIRKAFELLK